MEAVITACITGGLSLIAVIVSNVISNRKVASDVENQLKTSQAVTSTKLESLTEEVRKHNNFASRIPIVETKIEELNHRVNRLERET